MYLPRCPAPVIFPYPPHTHTHTLWKTALTIKTKSLTKKKWRPEIKDRPEGVNPETLCLVTKSISLNDREPDESVDQTDCEKNDPGPNVPEDSESGM